MQFRLKIHASARNDWGNPKTIFTNPQKQTSIQTAKSIWNPK